MRIIKLDGRYRWYPEFDQALYYPMREWKTAERVIAWLHNQYGPYEIWNHLSNFPVQQPNPMWRADKKKRRIYIKNPADISMALLLTAGQT